MKYLFFLFLLFSSSVMIAQSNIIPAPVSYHTVKGKFIFNTKVSINLNVNNSETLKVKQFLSDFLSSRGIHTEKGESSSILLLLNKKKDSEIGDEGYHLQVNRKKIKIKANTIAGLFYGVQTLKQLFPVEKKDTERIPCCEITDYPRFKWRGLMLDVSRHFFNVKDIKKYLDKMAEYKFNTFHWHLTDDNGWRIEIKTLPLLTKIGAWRVERQGGFFGGGAEPKSEEKATYGGFYTHEQIKDIVKYAENRNITIVPEVDMPGHSMAALAAYPNLSTKKEPKHVNPGTKFSEWYGDGSFKMLIENTLNPADEEVYTFVDKVFTEIAELFPGEYIHMGGDECYHGYWENSKDVKRFMKKNDIKNTHELQAYFVSRVQKIITSKGKKMIGWDEIFEGELSPKTAIMSWRGMKSGRIASKKGYTVVMSPTTYAYLDYTQGDYNVENKVYASLSLEKVYKFDPLPKGANPLYILGGQGNLWTEKIATMDFAFYMTYPRAFALSESLWSPKKTKNWNSFIRRTQHHFLRFDECKANISKAVYEPIVRPYILDGKLMCKLSNSIPKSSVYYTIDNTYPPIFGKKYTGPFLLPDGVVRLRTQTYIEGRPIGRELIIRREELKKRIGGKKIVFED